MAGGRGLGTERRPTAFVESGRRLGFRMDGCECGVPPCARAARCWILNRFICSFEILLVFRIVLKYIGNCSWAE
jgi:hypothetical protein